PPMLRARAFMGMGLCEEERLYRLPKSKVINTERWGNAVWAYTMANKVCPQLADPLYHRAVLLNKAGLYDRAEVDLLACDDTEWLDDSLLDNVDYELSVARRGAAEKQ
ncbi:MAG TPA: hypothetical protein V6D17_16345, partial [Candidatus Obscuribacterales bacterium]